MSAAATRITKAEAVTDRVLSLVQPALNHLARFDGRVINGYGVFSDPSQLSQSLYAARRAIQEALDLMSSIDWPTSSDYDEEA